MIINYIFKYLVMILMVLFFSSCGKKANQQLAQSYYKMSLLELNDFSNQNSYRKSLEYINKALVQHEKAEYLALKATLLLKLNYKDEGLNFFDKALLANPTSQVKADILNNKACLLAQIAMKENDIKKLDQAIDIWFSLQNDKNYLTPEVAFVNSGKAYFYKKDYQKVKELLLAALKLSPGYLDAHYYLAYDAFILKDFSLATKEIQTVLYLEPNHEGAKELLKFLQN
ncbi:hypothetical protein GF322_03840 [Candidatus Dependentiae bacterium]|nr:hypothetical protein [Candidatus Dependentiae bacterium]